MLVALARLGASLKLFHRNGSPAPLLQLSRAHLSHSGFSTSLSKANTLYNCLAAPRSATATAAAATMIKQALQSHDAVAATATSPTQHTYRQATLGTTSTRTLGNPVRQNSLGSQRPFKPVAQGIKRTSSGIAKSFSSQDDFFDDPILNIAGMDKENDLPPAFYNSSRATSTSLATALFDDNDFDSDIDLDIEDPATKRTATLPTLTRGVPAAPRDSAHGSKLPAAQPKIETSSQPIPWSSSPLEHFKTPTKPAVQTKRRHLPWGHDLTAQSTIELDHQIELEKEETQPKKRRSQEPEKAISTPARTESKAQYPFNVTASGLKQQQKVFREQMKAQTKSAQSTDESVKEAKKKKAQNSVHRIFLSEEQQNVLNLVTEYKKSVFFTGSAGTGKSVLLREIITALRRKYSREPDRVAVTASTGLAACNIGGVTLHSFAGIGLGKEPAEDLVKKIRRNQKAKQRWMRTKVLIMDEVSMVDGDLFDKLEQIARIIRNNGRPFGGIQLVITGDFFQLPPVPDTGRTAKFAFDAGTWTTSIEHTIGLHHVFRQKDPVFAGMLNEMREGRLTPESIARFKELERPLATTDDDIEATELFPTRSEVDRANSSRMVKLHGNVFTFEARDGGTINDKAQRDRLLQSCMVPEQVHLKKGAQVMLVKNMDDTLVNGSLGKVIGFMTEPMFAIYKDNEEELLNGDGPSEAAMKAEQAKLALGLNTAQVYPLVRFANADGTTRDLLTKREEWKVELPNGEVQASRSQIPLILAWALSIHKAQGQTLERVRVDLGKVFEKGQAYVALSRATCMAGLQIVRFDARKVVAHDKVRNFYASLESAQKVEGKAKGRTILGKMQAAKGKALA